MNLLVTIFLLSIFLQKKSALQTSIEPSLKNNKNGDIENSKKTFVVARVYPSEYLELQRNKGGPDESLLLTERDEAAAVLDILNQIDDNDNEDEGKNGNQFQLQTTKASTTATSTATSHKTKDLTSQHKTEMDTTNTMTTAMTDSATQNKDEPTLTTGTTPSTTTEQRKSPDDEYEDERRRRVECNCNNNGIVCFLLL